MLETALNYARCVKQNLLLIIKAIYFMILTGRYLEPLTGLSKLNFVTITTQ